MIFQCHDAAGQSSHIRMQARNAGMAACPVFIELVDNLRLISQTDVGNAVPLIVCRYAAAFIEEDNLVNAPCSQCFLGEPAAVSPADSLNFFTVSQCDIEIIRRAESIGKCCFHRFHFSQEEVFAVSRAPSPDDAIFIGTGKGFFLP